MTLKAAPDWGDDGEDVSPRSDEYLEFTYSRLYNAYNEDDRVATDGYCRVDSVNAPLGRRLRMIHHYSRI